MNVKFHKITSYTWIFQNFNCVFTILVKFDTYFVRLPWGMFFGVNADQKTNYIFSIWKTKKKECNIFFKLFWYKVFVHLKFKLLNFLVDSVLSWISSPFAWIGPNKTNNKNSSAIEITFKKLFKNSCLSNITQLCFVF